ncbi:MAG: hypothetical protein IT317_17805 [Anaerolineales bacterium]|nr:hypothetical protein [Anaerolineales bacterium]
MRPTGLLAACLLAFWLTLAAVIGLRQPDETRQIALGVLLGVAAGVPTSLVISGVLARYPGELEADPEADAEPEIVFVPAPAPVPANPPPARRTPPPPRPRAGVNLIGGDERDD